MDWFEYISNHFTLFLLNKNFIKEESAGTFDYKFGQVFFFITTFIIFMLIGSLLVGPISMFITIFVFNIIYNLFNFKVKFHALKMQNCALISGLVLIVILLFTTSLNALLSFNFSYLIYNVVVSACLSKVILSERGMFIFRWIECKYLYTKLE